MPTGVTMRASNLWATAVRVAPDQLPVRSRDGWQVRPAGGGVPVVRGMVDAARWWGMGVAAFRWSQGSARGRPQPSRVLVAGATAALIVALVGSVIAVPVVAAAGLDGGWGVELLARLVVVLVLGVVAWLPFVAGAASYTGARNQVLAAAADGAKPDLEQAVHRSPRAARNAVTVGWVLALLFVPITLISRPDLLGLVIRFAVALPMVGVVDEILRLTDSRPSSFAARLLALPGALLGMRPTDEHRAVALAAWDAIHQEKTIALTFDDGPHPEFTPRIAEALQERGVTATFFVVGERAREHPEIVRALAAAGHSVQNHSLTHVDLRELDDAGFAAEIDGAADVLQSIVTRPRCVRPPFGRHDDAVVQRIEQRGLRMVLWDISVLDWKQQPARWIAGEIARQAEPGSVVLLHDGGGDREQTVRAVPMLVDSLVERGYQFVRID